MKQNEEGQNIGTFEENKWKTKTSWIVNGIKGILQIVWYQQWLL